MHTYTKIYSYLTDDSDGNKKSKGAKRYFIKRKLKFEDYKYCLEATDLKDKMNHPEKNEVNVNSLWENHEKFMKNNKLVLKL